MRTMRSRRLLWGLAYSSYITLLAIWIWPASVGEASVFENEQPVYNRPASPPGLDNRPPGKPPVGARGGCCNQDCAWDTENCDRACAAVHEVHPYWDPLACASGYCCQGVCFIMENLSAGAPCDWACDNTGFLMCHTPQGCEDLNN